MKSFDKKVKHNILNPTNLEKINPYIGLISFIKQLPKWDILKKDNLDKIKTYWEKTSKEDVFLEIAKNIADNIVDKYIDLLETNYEIQQKSEVFLKDVVINIVNEKHNVLEEKMKEKLAELSNDDLKNLIENRVGDDLQMIRINGSVVGAIVGMMLYFITFIVERFV